MSTAGSKLVWVLDSERRSALVYRKLLAPRRIDAGGSLDGENVLPGFSVSLEAILDF